MEILGDRAAWEAAYRVHYDKIKVSRTPHLAGHTLGKVTPAEVGHGSIMEAEDIVQEAYLRYRAIAPRTIHSPRAFLSTVVTGPCLNQLASARAQREAYIGVWLPEPILTGERTAPDMLVPSPQQHMELHESLSLAFLALLEQLSPIERAVFLLREASQTPLRPISLVGRSLQSMVTCHARSSSMPIGCSLLVQPHRMRQGCSDVRCLYG